MKKCFFRGFLVIAFLSAGAFGAKAEDIDLAVACRTVGDLEHFGAVVGQILAYQNISVNTGIALAVTQEDLGKSCIVADIDSFGSWKALDDGNGDMAQVVYTDPNGVTMSLIGFTPMDEDSAPLTEENSTLAATVR